MKNEMLYNRTIDILIDAYHKDTLVHGNCYACAVGNIIAANCGYKFEEINTGISSWRLKWTGFNGYMQGAVDDTGTYYVRNGYLHKEIPRSMIKQIKATGYTIKELQNIEYAFEHSKYNSDDYMFSGLMAVVDVLDKIHENNDSSVTKQRFVKAKKVVTV